jgi:cyclohexadienyl dehydratase
MTFRSFLQTVLMVLCLRSLVSGQTIASKSISAPSRLDEIVARHTLRVCMAGDYPPYSLLRPDGGAEGIDVDLVVTLAQSLNVKVEFIKTSWPKLMNDFEEKCDIAAGGISTSLERQREAFFTEPYIVDGKTAIVRCGDVDKYQSIAQIDRSTTRVIEPRGGTNERFARRYLPHTALSIYPDNLMIFQQILDNRADVMVTDVSETLFQQKLNPGLCSVHPDKPFVYGEKAFMVPRGDVILQQYVNQFLHLSKANGDYQVIIEKWLK